MLYGISQSYIFNVLILACDFKNIHDNCKMLVETKELRVTSRITIVL